VLDSLVRTILSQNTTDTLSKRAFDSLKVIQIDPSIDICVPLVTQLDIHA
jgi:endonuclease III